MKKFMFILVALIGFGISAYADGGKSCSVKKGGEIIGYVSAWVDSNGCINVSNDTEKRVTVTVKLNSGKEIKIVAKAGDNQSVTTTECGYKGSYVSSVSNPICD
jgi:hypothetical protein